MQDKYHFFFGDSSPFSNFYKHSYDFDLVIVPTSEHAFMVLKALEFNDSDAAMEILSVKLPYQAKKIGRKVKNYDDKHWALARYNCMLRCVEAKFRSSEYLTKYILNTNDKILVEASPYDCIWGIGLAEDNPNRFDESYWRGQNLLGEVLMEVRDRIRKEQ